MIDPLKSRVGELDELLGISDVVLTAVIHNGERLFFATYSTATATEHYAGFFLTDMGQAPTTIYPAYVTSFVEHGVQGGFTVIIRPQTY